eukprot:GFYU01004016.1.p1 GENE.GFYU01004016.1~~GFYU01004016.1.p1  ORF type:complete len:112 (+),score=15.43 GFYU01004016.1:143-478(+)
MGVSIQLLQAGDGKTYPKKSQTIAVHYTGYFQEGANLVEFDSTYKRTKPFTFKLGVGQVIKGWDEAVPQLSLGEKARVTMTPDVGYGSKGFPGLIPPNSKLVFEVELLGFD